MFSTLISYINFHSWRCPFVFAGLCNDLFFSPFFVQHATRKGNRVTTSLQGKIVQVLSSSHESMTTDQISSILLLLQLEYSHHRYK